MPFLSATSLPLLRRPRRGALAGCLAGALLLCAAGPLRSQSSSSSEGTGSSDRQESSSAPRIAQAANNDAAITLETSEPLFDLAVALNSCGYDADLESSNPLRRVVRGEVAAAVAATPEASKSHEALCTFVRLHSLTDPGRSLAQYVSLAIYTSPQLMPVADLTELPPDAAQVAEILPLLRTFSEQTHLHLIWVAHRADYTGLVDQLHGPLSRMILNTNIYLHQPVSSYDDRRFLVLLEPMLAPSAINARIYGANYIITVSPTQAGSFHLEQIRHTFLHYEVEPMIYARAAAMDRLMPLLKTVQDAPIEFSYKSDIVALITECLIKAIEARTMDPGLTKPVKPTVVHQRADMEHYQEAVSAYDRQVEAVRRNTADASTHHGWILTDYFYDELIREEHDNISLKENIGQMVYGMDVDRQRHFAQQLTFTPDTTGEVVRRAAVAPTGLQLAEVKLVQGDAAAAQTIAEKTLADPHGDHSAADYLLGRVGLLQRQPEAARAHFMAALNEGRDPHTVAWSHIYLGRLFDVQLDRRHAVQEYQAALQVPAVQPEARAAATVGLKTAFTLPRTEAAGKAGSPDEDDDNTPVDPSGKAEKQAYQPSTSK